MESLPSDLCSHIVTDKRWLEENLLCLASNAVKFQMQGEVEVRCSVVEVEGGPESASGKDILKGRGEGGEGRSCAVLCLMYELMAHVI
jgi:hypothetical protein